jgi:hypothetical protein
VLGAQHGITGLVTETLVDLSALSPAQLDRLARTPGAALGTSRQRLDESSSRAALATLRAHRVTAVVAIGGNDTAASALALLAHAEQAGYPLAVVLAPKTIDNDLAETDHTPGYPSAARFLALATRDLMLDCRSLATFYAFTVLEVQGRNAGWLVAACGLAIDESLATHLQLVFPERPPRSSHDLAEEFASLQQRLGWLLLVSPKRCVVRTADPWPRQRLAGSIHTGIPTRRVQLKRSRTRWKPSVAHEHASSDRERWHAASGRRSSNSIGKKLARSDEPQSNGWPLASRQSWSASNVSVTIRTAYGSGRFRSSGSPTTSASSRPSSSARTVAGRR